MECIKFWTVKYQGKKNRYYASQEISKQCQPLSLNKFIVADGETFPSHITNLPELVDNDGS